MHTTPPRIDDRSEVHYAGIRSELTMEEMTGDAIPALLDEVAAWLERHDVTPAGPPFVRYHVIDMASALDIEACIPVSAPVAGDGRVGTGVLPAGRYAWLVYTGVENGVAGNAVLIDWAAERGVAWDDYESERGHGFRGRYETFLTDPADEPDHRRWQTEVAILIAASP